MSEYEYIERTVKLIDFFVNVSRKMIFESFFDIQIKMNKKSGLKMKKKESVFAEYQHPEPMKDFILKYDRMHPVDRVFLNEFNRKTGNNLEEVKMVYGNGANEITRSNHALAITVADTIFFRNGAYKPETEEGRKLLSHELTHVAQFRERPLADNRTKETLEAQAEYVEQSENYNADPLIEKVIGNTTYSFAKKEWKNITENIHSDMSNWIELQEKNCSEEEYLKLLINYKKWEEDLKTWDI